MGFDLLLKINIYPDKDIIQGSDHSVQIIFQVIPQCKLMSGLNIIKKVFSQYQSKIQEYKNMLCTLKEKTKMTFRACYKITEKEVTKAIHALTIGESNGLDCISKRNTQK